MASGADDKAEPVRPIQPYQPPVADQGRGDMVSENRAASERFERNSQALQREQAARQEARGEQGKQTDIVQPTLTQQFAQAKELTFGLGRGHHQDQDRLKSEQAQGNKPYQPDASKELSFGEGRQPRNYGQLKQEHAQAADKDQEQQQSGKKGLTFGPGRNQGQTPEQDQGLSR